MSTGDMSEYLRKKMAERRSEYEQGGQFMKSGFQRWAENERPARYGGAKKEPEERASTKAGKDILDRVRSLGEDMFAQYYKGTAKHIEGKHEESESDEEGEDMEGGLMMTTNIRNVPRAPKKGKGSLYEPKQSGPAIPHIASEPSFGKGYSGNARPRQTPKEMCMDKMRKQDQTPAQAAARCAGKGRITDLKTRHLAPAGKGKLEVIHHEDGHGMEIKEGKGKKRGKQSAKDFLKKMVGVGGATIPEAKAHGIKPSMKTYVKETVGKGYDEGTAIRESEENSDAEASGRVESTGSGKRSTRAAIVKKVMKDKGLSLIEASKYVKAHGLYKA